MTGHDEKTRCEWLRDRIEPYLDGELAAIDTTVFESHLGVCAHCSEELELAKRVLGELRSLPAERCPDTVTSTVFETIGSDQTRPTENPIRRWLTGWRHGQLRPALVGLFVLIVTVSAVLVARHHRSTNRITPEEMAKAEAELRWTLALVGDVGRRTGLTVRDDVLGERVVRPMRRAVFSVLDGGSEPASKNNGG
ncbi:MAG: zf-HC2 domain-containing protein [Candidatus Latescibacterota bacterium]|nr:MAG: zf-HC2 domain-containing protein [Candidatus Latescibacterota bacterium]